MSMEAKLKEKRIRALAELMMKLDKGEATEEQFERIAKGLHPFDLAKANSLYNMMTGNGSQTMVITSRGEMFEP